MSRVIVATDDVRIARAVEAFGGTAVMTRVDHQSGTDRIAEVARHLSCDIIVNVQGDEPVIDPGMIDERRRAAGHGPRRGHVARWDSRWTTTATLRTRTS